MSPSSTPLARLAVAGLVALALGCSGGSDAPNAAPAAKPAARQAPASPAQAAPAKPAVAEEAASESPEQLVARGKASYITNCAACHNRDPALEGALGPAVTGSSMELLEARVLRAEYPPGYKPKRDSTLMLKLPHLERELPALYAYLNQQG